MPEQDRIAFVERRDGIEGAKAFCRQGLVVYRAALKTPYGEAYRRPLIESLIAFRRYLRSH